MDGVTILNTTTTGRNWFAIILLAVYGIIFTVFTILIIVDIVSDGRFNSAVIFNIGIAIISFGLSIAYYNKPSQTTYKVTIDDSVSFNDFYERYNIIRQDGKIYTVEERLH